MFLEPGCSNNGVIPSCLCLAVRTVCSVLRAQQNRIGWLHIVINKERSNSVLKFGRFISKPFHKPRVNYSEFFFLKCGVQKHNEILLNKKNI